MSFEGPRIDKKAIQEQSPEAQQKHSEVLAFQHKFFGAESLEKFSSSPDKGDF